MGPEIGESDRAARIGEAFGCGVREATRRVKVGRARSAPPAGRPPRRPGNSFPAPAASHPLSRLSGPEGGCTARRRPEIRLLLPPGTTEPQHAERCSLGSRKRWPGAGPATAPGLRRRRSRKPGAVGFLRPVAALSWPRGAMVRLLPRSGGALAGRLRVWTGQPGRPAKRCVFPGPRGPGEPCVFTWWEWFTGKVDGRYPANRHALYCLGVNSLESKYQQSLWNVFPLVRGLKISHEKHHCALAEVLAGCSIIPLLCPKKPPHIPSGCRPLDFSV
ncbi:uncharacterized protein [Chlorocebus sabaeus]|uniref:uncharacterized protein n=1 Tax=Chlorocebus sabaeus TaxID=60711 RepID=UPI003BF99DB9